MYHLAMGLELPKDFFLLHPDCSPRIGAAPALLPYLISVGFPRSHICPEGQGSSSGLFWEDLYHPGVLSSCGQQVSHMVTGPWLGCSLSRKVFKASFLEKWESSAPGDLPAPLG